MSFFFLSFFYFVLGIRDIEHERWWLLRLCRGCGLKEMTLLSDIYPDIIVPIFRWHHLERLYAILIVLNVFLFTMGPCYG